MSAAERVSAARAELDRAQAVLDTAIDRLFEAGHRSGVTAESFASAAAARDQARRALRAAIRDLRGKR